MNRHIVDQLADVRASIKALSETEARLKAEVSAAMGASDALGGDEHIAMQKLTERKGGIDEKAMKAAGIDPERFRKPPVTVMSIAVQARVACEVAA